MKAVYIFFVIILNCHKITTAAENFGSVLIGGPCTASADCVGDPDVSSECDRTTLFCKCKDNFLVQRDLKDCLPIRNDLGDPCKEPEQCQKGALAGLADCVELECQCIDAAIKDPAIPECLPKANFVGDGCRSSVQCGANLDWAICNGKGECECENAVPKGDLTKCLPLVETIGGICEETPQCTAGAPGPHSECKDLTCQCTEGSVTPEVGETCLLEAGYDGVCRDNAQCKATLGQFGECSRRAGETEGVCRCRAGEGVPNEDKTTCLPVADDIGVICEVDAQCEQGTPGEYSSCWNSTCHCTDLAIQIPGDPYCHKKAEFVQEPCIYLEQCTANLGNWSECQGDTCGCSEGSVVSRDNRKCLPGPVLIGQDCEDDNQCVEYAKCSATGQCGCVEGYIPNGFFDRCLPIQEAIGGRCEERVQCQHGAPGNLSDCIVQDFTGIPEKVCNCTEVAVARPGGNQCYLKAGRVGDPCEFLEQCSVPLGLSLCYGTTCICSPEANPSSDRSRCLLKAELGEPCTDHGQCSHIPQEKGASCLPKSDGSGALECQCNPGHFPDPEALRCLKMAAVIGDSCLSQEQCQDLPGSRCVAVNGTTRCHCDYSSEVANGQKQKCLPIIPNLNEGTCEETVQCRGNNAECLKVNGIPQCRCNIPTFVESLQNPGNCVPIVPRLDLSCEEDIQCHLGIDENSECRQFSCQCREYHQPYQGHCYVPSYLGGVCRSHEECHAGINNLTRCTGTCECLDAAVEWRRTCWADKQVGDPCTTDTECRITIAGDAWCDLGKCSCPVGQVAQIDNRYCAAGGATKWLSASLFILSSVVVIKLV